MGWSNRRTDELNQRGHERRMTPGRADCPPGEERHASYWSALANEYRVQYDYRHPDGMLFSCVRPTLAECQAARNAWLVERVAAAQRERARAEAQDAAALVDADLYRDDRGNYS